MYPNINRANSATTIYPPVAQAIFLLRGAGQRHGDRHEGGHDGVRSLGHRHRPPPVAAGRAAAGARADLRLESVAAWEIAGNGHVDGAAIALHSTGPACLRLSPAGTTGAALACATLVKLLPICLFPALWRRWDWRMPVTLTATLVFAYLPYLGVGAGVLGYLPGYAAEEGMDSGAAYYPCFCSRA